MIRESGAPVDGNEFLRLLKAHIEHVLELIRHDTKDFNNNDGYPNALIKLVGVDLTNRSLTPAQVVETTLTFNGLPNLQIGWEAKDKRAVNVELNRRTNDYFGVTSRFDSKLFSTSKSSLFFKSDFSHSV